MPLTIQSVRPEKVPDVTGEMDILESRRDVAPGFSVTEEELDRFQGKLHPPGEESNPETGVLYTRRLDEPGRNVWTDLVDVFDVVRGAKEYRPTLAPQVQKPREQRLSEIQERVKERRKAPDRYQRIPLSGGVYDTGEIPSYRELVVRGLADPEKETEAEKALNENIKESPEEPTPAVAETQQGKWGEVLWDSITNAPAVFKRQYGGAKMFLNAPRDLYYALEYAKDEGVDNPIDSFYVQTSAYAEGKAPDVYFEELVKEAAASADYQEGQTIAQEANRYLSDYRPRVAEDSAKYYVAAIVEGTIQMAPALVTSIVLRSPTLGASLMGGQVFADTYANGIENGRTHSEAVMDGMVFAAAETLTERIPLGILTKGGGTVLKRILRGGAAEGLQEPITEIIQIGYEMGVIDDEMTLGEAMVAMWRDPETYQKIKRAAIIGAGVGTGLGSITHPFVRDAKSEGPIIKPPPRDKPTTEIPSEATTKITDADAREVGAIKVPVTQDLLERAGAGDPLTMDEQYTLTEGEYGRFVGERGSERVMMLPKGRRELTRLQEEEQIAEAEPAAPEIVGEEIILEGEAVTVEPTYAQPISIEAERKAPAESFSVDEPGSRRSQQQRLDQAANEAATSTKSPTEFPTDAQIRAGNYQKGHLRIQAVPIAIENPRLSKRSGTDPSGKKWETTLTAHYGYIKGVIGKDKDHIDVFVGPNPRSNQAIVINQKKDPNQPLSESNFDEHKIMMGFDSIDAAIQGYLSNYAPGWQGLGSVVPMTVPQLRQWMDTGNTTKIAPAQVVEEQGVEFAENKPVSFRFVRNTEAAPDMGERFQQDIEPVGTYMVHNEEPGTLTENWVTGEVTFKQPLIIPLNARGIAADNIYDKNSWKNILSQQYQGKTGIELSQALRADGYDGIVTVTLDKSGKPHETREIVSLKQIRGARETVKTRPRPIERRRTNEGKGISVRDAQNAIQQLYRVFRNAPPVRVVESIEDLPMHLQQSLKDIDADKLTTGIYDQGVWQDNVWIVANNTDSQDQAIETTLHEIVGHYGLRRLLDANQYHEFMTKVNDSFPKEVRQAAKRNGLNMLDPVERLIAAEEFIAYTAQRMLTKRTVSEKAREFVKKLRTLLAKLFGRITGKKLLSSGQIDSIIAEAFNYVRQPGGFARDVHRGALRNMKMPWYYSQMFKAINDDQSKSRSPADWNNLIKSMVKKGQIKAEEVKWSGIEEWLDDVTWRDALNMARGSMQLGIIPKDVYAAFTEMENTIGRDEIAKQQYTESRNAPNAEIRLKYEKAVDVARKERKAAGKVWDEIGVQKPKKLPKELVLQQIENEGTRIEVHPPGEARVADAAHFDEDYPDDSELQASEDSFYEDYDQFKMENIGEYYADALTEVHSEHKWNPNIGASDLDYKELGITQEELYAMDEEELNQAAGWDGTSEDSMEEEAQEQSGQAFDDDYYEDKHSEWEKENTRKTWYLGDYRVETDTDGDYMLYYDPAHGDGDYEELGYSSSESEINNMIESHSEDQTGTRWSEYVLPGGENYEELLFKWDNPQAELFSVSGHWGANENMVAHVRFDERKDDSGRPILFIDEIQSDWHQEARDQGVLDPIMAKAMSEQSVAYWNQYLNEVQPEIMSEMMEWDLTPEIAASFEMADVASKQEAIRWLSTFVEYKDKWDRHVQSAIMRQSRLAETEIGRAVYAKHGVVFKETVGFPGGTAKKELDWSNWDDTPIEEMQLEAEQRVRDDPKMMADIKEGMEALNIPEPISWSEWLNKLYEKDVEADKNYGANPGRANVGMKFAQLYTAMAPNINQDTKLKIKRLADSKLRTAEGLTLIKENAELRSTADLLMLEYGEVNRKLQSASSGISPAPFEKTWQLLVMKYMIREAVDRNYSSISMATGEVHGFRWNGAKKVDQIRWYKIGSTDTRTPDMFDGKLRSDSNLVIRIDGFHSETKDHPVEMLTYDTTLGKMSSVVGHDVAQLIRKSDSIKGTVDPKDVGRTFLAMPKSGSDVLSGGREIYNVITPNIVNKFLKKYKTRMVPGMVRSALGQDLEEQGVKTVAGVVKVSRYKDWMVKELTREQKRGIITKETMDKQWFGIVTPEGVIHHPSTDGSVSIRRLEDFRATELRASVKFEAWSIEITPELKAGATGGFPLFSRKTAPIKREGDVYQIIDRHTGEQVGKDYTGKNARKRATTRVDKLDNEYGAYRYYSRRVDGAAEKGPLFARKPTGDPEIDDALEWASENIGPRRQFRALGRLEDRFNEIRSIDRKARKAEQAMVDQFAGIKWAIRETHGFDLPAEVSGHKQAHFTTSQDAQMYAFMTQGIPEWQGGITQIKEGTQGLLEIVEPVADKITEWGYWMAARRAQGLMEQDREHLFTKKQIDGLLKFGEMFPEFQDVADAYNDWKSQFLDWASEAGVINEDTRPLWDSADYVPFYRLKADEIGGSFSRSASYVSAGIANQLNPIKRLKGGTQPLGDIMENIIVNFQQIADTAMKNQATRSTIANLEGSGMITPAKGSQFMQKALIAETDLKKKLAAAGIDVNAMPPDALNAMRKMWTIQPPTGDNIISVLVNGKKKYYNVHEETLLRSFTAINQVKFNSLMGRLGMWAPRKAKRLLTSMITLAPGFMAANWFRDIYMAFANSRDAKIPGKGSLSGIKKAITLGPEMVSMMAAGGAFYSGFINAMDPGATSKSMRRALRQTGFRNNLLNAPWKLFHAYNDIGAAMENANRIGAAYIPALKAGKSKAEAVWESKDLMNFAKHGDHAVVQFFIQTVPFMNARIQGLVRYGQRFVEAPGITFAKSFLYSAAVFALWMSNKDDERYKQLTPEMKDMYIHFWVNGNHYMLPKAFEVGGIFGTMIGERIPEYFLSQEDDAGKVAMQRLAFMIQQTFAFDYRPQLIKPMTEVANNYNMFFQGKIVPTYMEEVPPEMQMDARTSPTAIEVAKLMPEFMWDKLRSAKNIEHLIRGYGGTLAGHAMMLTDDLVRANFDYPPRPNLRYDQIPFMRRFYRGDEPPRRTMYDEAIYEVRGEAKRIERAVAQMKNLDREDEIEAYMEGPADYSSKFTREDILDADRAIKGYLKTLSRMRDEMNDIWLDPDMSPEQKLREINNLYKERAEETEAAYRERPGAGNEQRISTESIIEGIDGMEHRQAIEFLQNQGMEDTSNLLAALPKQPSKTFESVLKDNLV